MQSRHCGSKTYNVYIEYEPNSNGYDSIKSYYCKCNSGCRKVGMCSHTCSVIWFLGFARHNVNTCSRYKNMIEMFDTECQETSENDEM